ncbi:MAG: hypothetical protein BWX88_03435 [Planctomycetes bacterium ADurb.Bin126]|nr:MAG: hypothetical protein BWX88_03435 [Planctomycetes bacterium ADurb.Bin126]HOD81760.1 hypothetical protein [Phycisphaerae bacterium]HQL74698.1 hypothetical protein [Phycisphaerae bacterium]
MDWDEEEEPIDAVPTRARRPDRGTNDRTVVAERSPQTQVEIERRVALYARQMEQRGYFNWLPPPSDED